jgi:Ca2+-binding RTX toxin-like protein
VGYFSYRGTVFDGVLARASVVARLDAGNDRTGADLVLTDNGAGTRVKFVLSEAALPLVGGVRDYSPSLPNGLTVTFGDGPVTLSRDDVAAVAAMAEADSQTIYATRTGQAVDRVEALALSKGGATFIYLAKTDGAGLSAFRLEADGTLAPVTQVGDRNSLYYSGITTLAHVSVEGQDFVITASATEHGVSSFRVGGKGGLSAAASVGAAEALPVGGPQALEVVSAGGRQYVILASAQSSSLTVLTVDGTGALTPVSQVMDDLTTRFAGASILESFSFGGRAFVLAGGSDDGLSLFTLLDDGRLMHLETVMDTTESSLSNITDIAVRVVGAEVQLFVLSGAEAGMSQFTLSPGALGDVLMGTHGDEALTGGIGNDILFDGAGQDVMAGGAGADTFVLTGDGESEKITDFEAGKDRLDLSDWGMIRDISAITLTPRAAGAILRYGDESVVLKSADGGPITGAQLTTGDILNVTRISLATDSLDGAPKLRGSTSGDRIVGGTRDQELQGYRGDDILTGGGGADTLHGGTGTDIADYSTSPAGVRASLSRPAGNTGDAAGDRYIEIEGLSGSDHADTLIGDENANTLEGGDGRDRLEGGGGGDLLRGGAGHDRLLGQGGNDTLHGDGGRDRIAGAAGSDLAYGGGGRDRLRGGGGGDTLFGEAGQDKIRAGRGRDSIDGGDGDDRLYGGGGRDRLTGGAGDDLLVGGAGADTFIFDDFTRGETDTIKAFDDGADMIRLTDGPGAFTALEISEVTVGSSPFVQVTYAGHTILVGGVSQAELDMADFTFG